MDCLSLRLSQQQKRAITRNHKQGRFTANLAEYRTVFLQVDKKFKDF